LENEMKEMTVLDEKLSLNSSMNEDNLPDLDALADSIIASMK
ncbi:MAG TPA: FprA family A-type flavoprotein, partial [Ruminococcaceae bacterium]|nr:FprA family A-type flavoprotein [Oscillospiraceae bacterium]